MNELERALTEIATLKLKVQYLEDDLESSNMENYYLKNEINGLFTELQELEGCVTFL